MAQKSMNPKSYKTATIFFAISGIIFIILSVTSQILFLPIGIALLIISFAIWQRRGK
jgi:hypothetical protein